VGIVRSLNPSKDLEDFCTFLYGVEEGYIHVPIKDPSIQGDGGYSYNHFFKWPSQKEEALDHIERHYKSHEVFITPGMFREPSSEVIHAHGSYVAWADFDGNSPTLEELKEYNIPVPTLRVQSSVAGREHWYWKFERFNSDIASVQGINKAICYALNADFAWDMGHSLRPVGTLNHKRGSVPVHVIKAYNDKYRPDNFSKVPVPQEAYNLEQFKIEKIPNSTQTLLKFAWTGEERALITRKNIEKGGRSSALTRLAYICCEKGMDNSEAYSILLWVDSRWKKYYNRENRDKYYVSIINYVRQKVPYEGIQDVPSLTEELVIRSWGEVVEYNSPIKWLVDGLLPHRGSLFLVGSPGIGKTTLAINHCANLALGRGIKLGENVIKWSPVDTKPLKVMLLSLEMMTEEVQDFLLPIQKQFSDEEKKILNDNFFIYSEAQKIKFYKNDATLSRFLTTLDKINPDIILVDSASRALASNISNSEEVVQSLERMELIREKFNCSMYVIHHPRKDPPNHGYKESELDDMFGSAFIAASASSVVALKKSKSYAEDQLIQVRELKTRFKGGNQGFSIKMNEDRQFYVPTIAAITQKVTTNSKKSNDSYFQI
jgi:hypothetical protein